VLVVGDGARLQQVAWNLVSNAVKFTPERGTVRVEVAVDHENGHVRIVVADTGPGIAPAFLPHAFDRFRQGDATATRAHEGLGLGLAIVKHLVELHGGRVTAESGPGQGQGARLTVTLPIGERGPSGASCRDPGAVTPRDPPFPFDDPHL
jgi:signal transduction histidine kinase